jgi:hypothetical protein
MLIGIPLGGYLVSRLAGPQPKYDLSTPALIFQGLHGRAFKPP